MGKILWLCGPWIQECLLYFLLNVLLLFSGPVNSILRLIERLVEPRVVHCGSGGGWLDVVLSGS